MDIQPLTNEDKTYIKNQQTEIDKTAQCFNQIQNAETWTDTINTIFTKSIIKQIDKLHNLIEIYSKLDYDELDLELDNETTALNIKDNALFANDFCYVVKQFADYINTRINNNPQLLTKYIFLKHELNYFNELIHNLNIANNLLEDKLYPQPILKGGKKRIYKNISKKIKRKRKKTKYARKKKYSFYL